ncbi:MAG: threonylcarbamoyl-AMP synthase [Deltaproteobacteria bacterium]|nr:threonylcarbamoyl-AMP synthase [Deltaproteobacteria bacterium]
MPAIIIIDSAAPDEAAVARAAAIIKRGGVIAYPTETFYGLGADPFNERAVERLFAIKGRNFDKPIPLIIGKRENLDGLVTDITREAELLIKHFWPGPLTLVFHAASHIHRAITADTGKVGIRLSSHRIARNLATALPSGVLTATSANFSGSEAMNAAQDVLAAMGRLVDAVIEGGATPGGPGSSVIDVTAIPPVIIRNGEIPKEIISDKLRRI